jgi:hypothetical protein
MLSRRWRLTLSRLEGRKCFEGSLQHSFRRRLNDGLHDLKATLTRSVCGEEFSRWAAESWNADPASESHRPAAQPR